VAEVNLELAHGTDDGDHGLYGVAVDDRLVLQTFFLRVALLMDNPGNTYSP